MNQTMHILRKDVRRLRWLLALWLALLAGSVVLAANAAAAAGASPATGLFLQQLWDTLEIVGALVTTLIVVQLVHE